MSTQTGIAGFVKLRMRLYMGQVRVTRAVRLEKKAVYNAPQRGVSKSLKGKKLFWEPSRAGIREKIKQLAYIKPNPIF